MPYPGQGFQTYCSTCGGAAFYSVSREWRHCGLYNGTGHEVTSDQFTVLIAPVRGSIPANIAPQMWQFERRLLKKISGDSPYSDWREWREWTNRQTLLL